MSRGAWEKEAHISVYTHRGDVNEECQKFLTYRYNLFCLLKKICIQMQKTRMRARSFFFPAICAVPPLT